MRNREPVTIVRLILLLAVAIGAALVARDAVAGTGYHVSYLWHRDLDSVRDYRRDVGAVLGPTVAENLTVVSNGKLFGLIYMRDGDSAGAARAAKSHSRLLRRAGLDAAAPVRGVHWSIVDSADGRAGLPASPEPGEPAPRAERDRPDRDLEPAVEDYIRRLRAQGRLADDERTGWLVYDITTGKDLVTINENDQFQAASLIKPFIATAFFHRVKNGDFKYGPKSRRHMERMIHRSDNRSTNWAMRLVGGPEAVQRILREHYGDIFRDTRIVEYIPPGGKTYRNKATLHDYGRFLSALWNDQIPGAREIRRLMALPGSDRIFIGARDIPRGTRVYNKTGSTAHLCGDMGILSVEGPDAKRYPYIIVGVIEKQHEARNYTHWIRSRSDVIRNVSNLVYKGIARYHDFGDAI